MRTKFCGNNFLGKGFRKTSADSFFLNSDVASGGGGVWGGILRLLRFLFWRNSGGLPNKKSFVREKSIKIFLFKSLFPTKHFQKNFFMFLKFSHRLIIQFKSLSFLPNPKINRIVNNNFILITHLFI